ncbi:hypothetical protein BGP77_08670 [Saccharospirillum sp. MSK14-1]|uniref:hypothetical protein n=1 Tax=Saccharospirillum sp. MSK14-1 TaxID=1897632 RepID=UPI000D3C8C10|nr:hypothetical protein [Saccharospirillum sp. MSK14-1]PTY35709.1 hypothetical protein BGP77_08670 [Saccharospirillum sp. MSK14-1]
MIYKNTRFSKTLNVLVGALVFALGTSAGTFYLQDTLFVFIQFNSYAHWAAVLIGLPILMGLIQRLIKIVYPLFSTLIGTFISAAVLYPLYGSRFWAEPPQLLDMLIYILIVSGIGFLASQPLRTTFLAAFRIKRSSPSKPAKTSKPAAKSAPKKIDGTRTQRVSRPASSDRSVVALIELSVGLISLALSIFSIFFLGSG